MDWFVSWFYSLDFDLNRIDFRPEKLPGLSRNGPLVTNGNSARPFDSNEFSFTYSGDILYMYFLYRVANFNLSIGRDKGVS